MRRSARPLGEKGALVFSDDFSADRFGSVWTERIKSAGVENGVMYARQTTKAHGAVATAKLDLPHGNLICECRVQIEHNATLAFSFDDMKYPGSVPMKVETHAWHTFSAEIVGDRMRVTLDGKPVGLLQSPGLAHSTKPDLKISLSGKQALLDDLHVWAVKDQKKG
jgi:hypothetical protein